MYSIIGIMLQQLLSQALKKLKVSEFDVLYLYSDLRELGKLKFQNVNKEVFLDQILSELLKLDCTVIVPTFSYTTQGIFYPKSTPTRLGALNAYVLKRKDIIRSNHPLFSHASIGSNSFLLEKIGKSAFGKQSLYSRLITTTNLRSAFLYLGRPVSAGNTMPHYIEQIHGVEYRFEKDFPVKVLMENQTFETGYSAFVRKQDNVSNDYSFSFKLASNDLYSQGAVSEVFLKGKFTNISIVEIPAFYSILSKGLNSNSSYFLKNSLV
jgi:aminoglycoside N3'-acetyltransferase